MKIPVTRRLMTNAKTLPQKPHQPHGMNTAPAPENQFQLATVSMDWSGFAAFNFSLRSQYQAIHTVIS